MSEKLAAYKQARKSLDDHNEIWPLYGAGFENIGQDGKPLKVDMPEYGPDELLVRHDACGLCFSDIKVIRLGEEHPRIYRDMRDNPVVLGHEVSMTVVGVGENLRDQYQIGDRFIIQADVWVDGVGYAYGYEIQGGLSRYGVIDQRVLNGDDGNYLLPVQPDTGYAESALTEPWACVIAAYQLDYRSGLKPGGTAWIIGTSLGKQEYTIGAGFDQGSHPTHLLLTNIPANFREWLTERAAELGVETIDVDDPARPPLEQVDDIILLGATPEIIETVSPFLADHGIMAVIAEGALERKVAIDIGRVHYNRWVYVGGTGPDVARAYSDVPVRPSLRPGGCAWFVGAGGPMGRMHVQRALQIADGPRTVVCTDVSDMRLDDLRESFAKDAEEKGVDFICLNPMESETYAAGMAPFKAGGFDDIVVMAPIPAVIEEAASTLAPEGVMNVFAGVARGTMVNLDMSDVYLKNVRWIGHSASTINDLRQMLHQAEAGELSPNRAVAAIGSLSAARAGLQAVRDAAFPGKVVIFPHIKEMPLTPLAELKDKLPTVYAKLKDGHEWTVEAEKEFLEQMLP
jgi:threonine dehydrogenase-like Zn-dependent dehydrogenase